MITDAQYMQIVSEAYDLSDYRTKKQLLFCNEAKRIDNLEHIVNNLYLHVKNNVAGIDFGTIPKSNGVVTRIENYTELVDCINSVHELVYTYKEKTDIPDALTTALANLQQRERIFSKAFALNIEIPMMIYNMTVLAVVSSVSLLLSGTIEYVKNGHDSFATSFDKVGYAKSRDHVLFQYVTQFNRNCDNGGIDKLMNECIKNNLTPVKESAIDEGFGDVISGIAGNAEEIGAVPAVTGAIAKSGVVAAIVMSPVGKVVLTVIGVCAGIYLFIKLFSRVGFYFFSICMKYSDWFELQANYLQINAENLRYRDDPKGDEHRRQVYKRQMAWVARFKKIANKLALDDSKASKKEREDNDRRSRQPYNDDDYENDGLF